ncbi:MAG: hypothetical protein ACTSW1_12650 [Candidatus Hodarchaeales archaeon]
MDLPAEQKTNSEKKRNKPKRTFSDNIRQFKYTLTSVRANLKFVFRAILRELKYFLPLQDLFILFLMILIAVILILILLLGLIPFSLGLVGQSASGKEFQDFITGVITSREFLRWAAGIIGVGTVIIRLMIKSPIMKFRDKVNTKKDVTYIFGSSRPAEQFLFEMVHQYGYEDKVALIADADLLWIRKLKSQIDIYIVENEKEFEKTNLYEIIGFKNASRVMVLTESIELNQNILTNIRQVRPDVDIILLSQYAPAFVFSELVKDEHLVIIEDLDATVQGLVYSLSLDISFPQVVEIDVPRTHIGSTGIQMTSDLIKQKVLLVRRDDRLLSPNVVLQPGDRVIIYFFSNYYMKSTNRIVTELPLKTKKAKKPETETIVEKIKGD